MGRAADARAHESEALRRLPADLAADLIGTRIFQAWVPPAYGGDGREVAEVLAAIEATAYWDGSLGWCAMIGATTSMISGWLSADWAQEIYGDPRSCTGGFALPAGRARPVANGLEVSGTWPWGSGTDHCTWIGGGVLLVDDEGQPTPRADGLRAPFVFFRRDQVELLDTWDVMGLRATASTDYRVDGALVSEGCWAQPGVDPPVADGALYRFPFLSALALGISAVALGLARRAFDELVDLAGAKRPAQSSRTLAERPVIQADVARAEAAFRSARAFVDAEVEAAWASAVAGPVVDRHRRDLRLAATNATLQARAAVDLMYDAAGGSAVHRANPLERMFRDVHVATQHGMVAPRTLEVFGRVALGLPTDASTY